MARKKSIGITLFALLIMFINGASVYFHFPLLDSTVQETIRLQAEKELPDLISKLDIKPIDPDLDLDSQRRLKEKIGKEYAQSEKNRYVKLSDKLQKTIINDALLSVIFSGILFISGIAILLRKNWGRILFLSTITMRLLFNLIQLAMSKIHIDPTPGAIALHIVVPVIIVAGSFFLLARPNNDFNSYSSPEV